MRLGHVLTLLGAALFLVGTIFMPWQEFTLAGLTVTSVQVSALAYLAIAVAAAQAGLSTYGLASGRRALTAKLNLAGAGLLVAWLVIGRVTNAAAFDTMRFEDVGMAPGFLAALWGAALTAGGAMVVLWALPAWDERQPFLRILTTGKDHAVLSDHVIFEPGVHSVGGATAVALGDAALARSLPHFRVTREGDAAIGYADERGTSKVAYAKIPHGAAGAIERGDIRIAYHFVAPIPGRASTRLLDNSEVAAIGLAVGVVTIVALIAPVLELKAVAKRNTACEDGKCSGMVMQREEEKVELADITPEPIQDEAPEHDVAKKAGGPEGTFGDPKIDPSVISKVPAREGPLVHAIDPRNIGLNAALNTNTGEMTAVAEVLKGDMAAMQDKLAGAMNGDGHEFVLGHGTNGLSFIGDDNGGGGPDGDGRIHGMSDIDTGPGMDVHAALGPKVKRRVPTYTPGPPTTSIGCKKANIESVVRRRAGVIRACYEQRLQVNASLKGKITMRWTIAGDGGVEGANATSDSLGDAETTNCLLRAVRRMKFEPPEAGICVIQWPFVFSPG